MKRREFISLVGCTAMAWPFAAQAQGKMRRIGVLINLAADDPEGQSRLAGFLQGLQEAGWAVRHHRRAMGGGRCRVDETIREGTHRA